MDPALLDPTLWLYLLAAVLVLVGLAGTVLPALPGIPLVFAGLLLAAWVGDFQIVSGWTLAVLGLMTLTSLAIDIAATALGAKRVGASGKAVAGAALGTLAGLFFGLIGLVIGPFVGAVAGEYLHRRHLEQQGLGEMARIGFGTWAGLLVGVALKLALAFAMLGIFAAALLIG
ncbi:DUF456 domain-containing protein [Silanimonas sp.]|uniref:DUF456 domain-containing protein n=1 Tax=Silanimonas sp. TaxID=1929290 RepID=UPI001BBC7950|nr:DUF456 domain-containing protein [Silanimonas sp.]MBS3896589.1 DUF456 domain-containing protein [Silanimonas sp.]MBS3924711.1 DUF456 domain-containing protein [Xanthomonadaceae bacterium]